MIDKEMPHDLALLLEPLKYGGVYVGPGSNEPERFVSIDPSLPVAAQVSRELWSALRGYRDLCPSERRAYIDWLASGRQGLVGEGAVRLYLAGAELALIALEQTPPSEATDTWFTEVDRLARRYRDYRYAAGAALKLRDRLLLHRNGGIVTDEMLQADDISETLVNVAAGQYAAAGKAITSALLLAAARHHPLGPSGLQGKRILPEILDLVQMELEEIHPAGVVLQGGSAAEFEHLPSHPLLPPQIVRTHPIMRVDPDHFLPLFPLIESVLKEHDPYCRIRSEVAGRERELAVIPSRMVPRYAADEAMKLVKLATESLATSTVSQTVAGKLVRSAWPASARFSAPTALLPAVPHLESLGIAVEPAPGGLDEPRLLDAVVFVRLSSALVSEVISAYYRPLDLSVVALRLSSASEVEIEKLVNVACDEWNLANDGANRLRARALWWMETLKPPSNMKLSGEEAALVGRFWCSPQSSGEPRYMRLGLEGYETMRDATRAADFAFPERGFPRSAFQLRTARRGGFRIDQARAAEIAKEADAVLASCGIGHAPATIDQLASAIRNLEMGENSELTGHLFIGRSSETHPILQDLKIAAEGGSAFRILSGEPGAGKSALLHYSQSVAISSYAFVSSTVTLLEGRRLSGTASRNLYLEIVENLRSFDGQKGHALAVAVHRFAERVLRTCQRDGGIIEDVVADALGRDTTGMLFTKALLPFVDRLTHSPDATPDESVLDWLSGRMRSRRDAKRLGLADVIDEGNYLAAIATLSRMFRGAGYSGLFLAIDEVASLLHLRSDVRDQSFDAILALVQRTMLESSPGLVMLLGCTEELLSSEKGMFRSKALSSRFGLTKVDAEVRALSSRIVRLTPLSLEHVYELLRRVRTMLSSADPDLLLSDQQIRDFMAVLWARQGNRIFQNPRSVILEFLILTRLVRQRANDPWLEVLSGVA